MIRWLLLLAAWTGLGAATPAPRDWTGVVNRTAAGSFVMGNPAARVKVSEWVSYTCPHCAAFMAQSAPTMRGWVRSGSTSVELHHQIHDGLDLAAALLARCAGRRFFEVTEAFYAAQPDWYARGSDFVDANQARLAMYPALGRLRAYADGAGLTDIARRHGLTPAAVDACFAGEADMDRLLAATQADSATISGTPTFAINGKLVGIGDWARLSPQLRAAGAH